MQKQGTSSDSRSHYRLQAMAIHLSQTRWIPGKYCQSTAHFPFAYSWGGGNVLFPWSWDFPPLATSTVDLEVSNINLRGKKNFYLYFLTLM